MSHTKGPWRYWKQLRAGGQETCTFFNNDKVEVLRAITKTITEDDARLIAAAPDLLEALQSILKDLNSVGIVCPLTEIMAIKAIKKTIRGNK